ncbi:MAG: EVE domain-containing protein [Planctomycetota bacterium]|nr:MAG: EVE domain-containing protein [Planctomycetota bacterium]
MAKIAAKAATKSRHYWLFKSEPEAYSIDDLARDGTTFWDGVRNYQARNILRDEIRVGDRVLFYHSNAEPMAIVGTMEVCKTGYGDHTARDKKSDHYDAKCTVENPIWFMVDVKFRKKFATVVTREMLAGDLETKGMVVMAKGSRLSIQPVTTEEWRAVHLLAGEKPD